MGIGVLICIPLIYSEVLPQVKLAKPLAWRVSAPPPPITEARGNPPIPVTQSTPSAVPVFRMPARNRSSFADAIFPLEVPRAPELPIGDGPVAIQSLPITTLPTIEKPTLTVSVTPVQKPPDQVIVVGGDVQAAKIIKKVLPLYPPLARQTRVSGTVRLAGVIAKDGTVQKLQVVSGNPLLVKAAVDAVSQWIYKPTVLDGQPVEVIAPIEVIFTLQ